MSEAGPSIQDLLNAQAGKARWHELERHFARGALVCVDGSLDLIEVAEKFVRDRSDTIENLQVAELVYPATDEDAVGWQKKDSAFWTVVVAPWVLVQEIRDINTGPG